MAGSRSVTPAARRARYEVARLGLSALLLSLVVVTSSVVPTTTLSRAGAAARPTAGNSRAAVLTGTSVASGVPEVSSISPSTVSAGGGATVTIIGSGFSGATAVYFGTNISSNFSVVSPNFINAAAPTNAGTVNVTVITPAGTSANTEASQLTYAPTGQLPITASRRNLEVGGLPTKFTGVNAFELATAWGTNGGCGGMESPAQTAALFASLGSRLFGSLLGFPGGLRHGRAHRRDRLGPPRPSLLPGRGLPRLPHTDHYRPGRDLRRGALAGSVLVRRRLPGCLQFCRRLQRRRPYPVVVLELHDRAGEPLQELARPRNVGADLGSRGIELCGAAISPTIAGDIRRARTKRSRPRP